MAISPAVSAWVSCGVLAIALVIAAVTDILRQKVYNWTTYPAIAIGLIWHALAGGLVGDAAQLGLGGSLLGLAAGFLPMLVFWLAGGIGGGDAKLMGAVGALAGWRFALSAMFYGFLIAAVMAMAVMIRRRILKRTLGRIWRVLYLALTPSRPAGPTTEESPKIAFGLALCIGSALALVELAVRGGRASKLILGI